MMIRMSTIGARTWRFTALGVGLLMACVSRPGLFGGELRGESGKRIGAALAIPLANEQEPAAAAAAKRALDAVDSAAAALDSVADDYLIVSAAYQVLDAVASASEAFSISLAQFPADEQYHEAFGEFNEFRDRCENGLACSNVIDALSAMSIANTAYAEAVDMSGAIEASDGADRAERLRRLATRVHDLEGDDNTGELSAAIGAEYIAIERLHERASVADAALYETELQVSLNVVNSALRAISAATDRLIDGDYTRAAEVVLLTEALNRRLAAGRREWWLWNEVIRAADQTVSSMERYATLVAREARDNEEWVREVNRLVDDAEAAAVEVEQASPEARHQDLTPEISIQTTLCATSRNQIERAVTRVQRLTFAGLRPVFVSVEAGDQVWGEMRGRLGESRQRARAACAEGFTAVPPNEGVRP